MQAFQFLNNPKPVLANAQVVNPALPFPDWQATGVPLPKTTARAAPTWDQNIQNPFPPRTLVIQPRNMTVIA